jgi:hypothetical protein
MRRTGDARRLLSMMKRGNCSVRRIFSCIGTAAFVGILWLLPVHAQEQLHSQSAGVTAVIVGPADTPVGRTIILSASASQVAGNNVQYFWYVNSEKEPISTSVDVIYTPERAGDVEFHLVIRSLLNGQRLEDDEYHTVTAFSRKVVLITDTHLSDAHIQNLQNAAASGSTYLRVLRSHISSQTRGGETALGALLSEEVEAFSDAESIVFWTDDLPPVGLQALLNIVKGNRKRLLDVRDQTFLLITDLNLRTVARTAIGPGNELHPKKLMVAKSELIPMLLQSKNDEEFLNAAFQARAEEPLIMDVFAVHIPLWQLLSRLLTTMLALGVSSQTILLLLVLPIIATILSFLKQVVGMTTFGLFTPSIIALSFLVLGWPVGVLFLLFILMTGYATRALMRRLHILYIPKMAIILGVGSLTILFLVGIGTFFGVFLSYDTVFVLLIMSTLVESFLNVKSEEGLRSAVFGISQTIIAALLCVFIVQWPSFRSLIIAYPEIILFTPIINILLGRWTGLRVSEYFRFREVFRHLAQE